MPRKWQHIQARETPEGVAIFLPADIVSELGVAGGGTLVATWDRDGTLSLSPGETEFDLQIAVARQVMRNDRAALAELAKS